MDELERSIKDMEGRIKVIDAEIENKKLDGKSWVAAEKM